jgi:hypothetical protein
VCVREELFFILRIHKGKSEVERAILYADLFKHSIIDLMAHKGSFFAHLVFG